MARGAAWPPGMSDIRGRKADGPDDSVRIHKLVYAAMLKWFEWHASDSVDDDGCDMEVLGSSRSFSMASHLLNEEVGTSRRQSFSRNKLEPVQEVGKV